MKNFLVLFFFLCFSVSRSIAQNPSATSGVDLMLLHGEYEKVIDTCKQLLIADSLNHEVWYRIGIAYQNTLEDELAINSFYKAATLNPGNRIYNFSLAKGYYNNKKLKLAEPLFYNLLSIDSANWRYGYYLSSIYMQSDRFDEAISIYNRFLVLDSSNYVYLDKTAFAYLRKGENNTALNLYNKSLSINNKDITAIKNLAHLYSLEFNSDTAIQILSRGIEIDSLDMDLYARRAQLYYSRNYTKRALDDYLVILESGDTTFTHLKRIGIGYCKNFQPAEAINYLLLAYKRDSSDYETCSYLGQSYNRVKDFKNSVYFYNKVIKILLPVNSQLGFSYRLCADAQSNSGHYHDAIASYLKSGEITPGPPIYMMIANIYDEKLNDKEKAIVYYQRFLNGMNNAKIPVSEEYKEKIVKRIAFLKSNTSK